jgi:hypothetical protein
MAFRIKICPAKDKGLIGAIKSRPHVEKGKPGGHVVKAWQRDVLS